VGVVGLGWLGESGNKGGGKGVVQKGPQKRVHGFGTGDIAAETTTKYSARERKVRKGGCVFR